MAIFHSQQPSMLAGTFANADDYFREQSPTPELANPVEPDQTLEDPPIEEQLIAKNVMMLRHMEMMRNRKQLEKVGRAWRLYHNSFDSSWKDPDQSDMRLPEAWMLTEQVSGILMAMIEQSSNSWWDLESLIPGRQVYANLLKRFVNFFLKMSNFWSIVEEAFKSGIITGQLNTMIVLRINDVPVMTKRPTDEEMQGVSYAQVFSPFSPAPEGSSKPFIPNPWLPQLEFRNIPTDSVLIDSQAGTDKKRYTIWQMDVPIGQVFLEADSLGYNREALLRAKKKRGSSTRQGDTNQVATSRKDADFDPGPEEGYMRLTFFEGTLHEVGDGETSGAIYFEDKYCVIANGCEVIYGPSETPWWDGEHAILSAPFSSAPHQAMGKGLISENCDALMVRHNTLNILLDYMYEALSGAWMYKKDSIADEHLRNGKFRIYPRVAIPVLDTVDGQPPIQRLQLAETSASTWQVVQAVEHRILNTTGTSDMGGAPRTRGRQTSMEAQARNAEAAKIWKNIFSNLERRYLSPLLRLGTLRLLQFIPDWVWSIWVKSQIATLLPPEDPSQPEVRQEWLDALEACSKWNAEQRYRELGNAFAFQVRLFSNFMERQAMIEKFGFLVRQLQPLNMLGALNGPEVLRGLVSSLGFDPELVLKKEYLLNPSSLDLAGIGNPNNPFNPQTPGEQEEFDVSGGLMGALSQAISGGGGNLGGVFPGGPTQPSPNMPTPPPGM